MTVSNEAVEAARQALHRVRWERMKRMIEGDRRALGEREPGDPPDMQEDARAALEAAAPHMLPAPEGVSEAEIVRHMTHEEWRGCRIESYRWKFKIPEALQGSEWDWSYASHWSTPAAHEEAEALVSVKDAERALLSALSSERERAERAEKERDEARAGMAYILDRAEYGDSYGVPGSSFTACHFCQGGGAPGAEMIHDPSCPVAKYPSAVSEWFAEMTDAESRAQAAEAKVKEAGELLDAFGRMLNEDHDNLPDELVVSLTYDDTAYDGDLGGPNTLLGELFLRVFRNARSAALRWTQGEGE